MNPLSAIALAATLAVGFFVGLLVLLIVGLFKLGFWVSVLVLLGVVAVAIAIDYLTFTVPFGLIFRLLGGQKTEQQQAEDRQFGRRSGLAFATGIVASFLASLVWTPVQIMGVF